MVVIIHPVTDCVDSNVSTMGVNIFFWLLSSAEELQARLYLVFFLQALVT